MTIKVFIKRKFKNGIHKEANRALNMARYGAMEQKDYISSETLSDIKDPTRVTVISMWRSLKGWEDWRNSEKRKAIESEIAALTESPTEYEYYALGIPHD